MNKWQPQIITLIISLSSSNWLLAQDSDTDTNTARTDTLIIPVGSQGRNATRQLPSKGMSKTDVSDQFGQPESQTEAVGSPPISRWHYREFSVYFEGDKVLHSVVKHQPLSP